MKGCNFIHQSINRCQCDSMRFREVLLHGHPAGQVDELGPLDARFLISASDGPFPPTSGSRSLLAIGNQSPRLSEETKGSGKRTELPSLLTVSCLKRIRSAESEGYLGPPNDLRSHRARVGRPTFTLCFADFSFHGSSSFFFCFPPPVRAWMNWRMTTVPKKTSGRSSWSWPTPSRTRP